MKKIAMIWFSIVGVGMSGFRMGLTVQPEYHLTVISDEQVPLAPSVPASDSPAYFLWTVVIMLLMAAVAVTAVYFGKCIKYRRCYFDMIKAVGEERSFPKPGWNLTKLKQLLNETENQLVQQMV